MADGLSASVDLTRLLRGKRIACLLTNGHVLQIRCHDGSEINVAWVDEHGTAIMGKPVVQQRGARLIARGLTDNLIFHPQALQR